MKTLRHTPSFRARGFTLIELLIVIGIVAMLAAVSFTVFGSVKKSAARMQGVRNFEQMWKAVETYKAQNQGYYPGTNADGGGLSQLQPPMRTTDDQLGFYIHDILHLEEDEMDAVEYEVPEMVHDSLIPKLEKIGREGWERPIFYLFHIRSDIGANEELTPGSIGLVGSYWGRPGANIEFNRAKAPMFSDIYLNEKWDDIKKNDAQKTFWGNVFNVLFVDGHVESFKEKDFDWRIVINSGGGSN